MVIGLILAVGLGGLALALALASALDRHVVRGSEVVVTWLVDEIDG